MEYLVSVVIWLLACYGMTNIIVLSSIMRPLRELFKKIPMLYKLFNCMLCMGFWVGVFWGAFLWDPFMNMWDPLTSASLPLRLMFDGCLSSAVTWIIYLKMYDLSEGK
tara:strand:- start:170 stop:493 length:324 start_codon:yes stop_codon:yes gene_type:complete